MDALTDLLVSLGAEDVEAEAVATALRGRFTVIDREREPQPTLMVGQVWRNRKSGRLVRIDRFLTIASYPRVFWVAISGDGPKTGSSYRPHWKARYTFVAQSEDDL